MNGLESAFPELARYGASELRPRRLLFGAALSLLVGGCLFLLTFADAHRRDTGKALFTMVIWVQAAVLLGYGTARVASSVMSERQEGTWDLQRLTPLEPANLAVGKLLGAPLFPLFLTATLMPWAILSLSLKGAPGLGTWVAAYLTLGAAAFLWFSIGLVVSTYGTEALERGSSATGGLMGLLAFQAFTPAMVFQDRVEAVSFHGAAVPWPLLWAFSAAALGAWAFLAAKWRIGRDLLLGPKWWRLPAFLTFLVWYQLGWSGMPVRLSVFAPAILVTMAAVLNGVDMDYWRQWLRETKGSEFLHRAPLWLNGAAAFAALAVLATAYPSTLEFDVKTRAYPFMQVCFLVRDLAFLQWVRLGGWKRPEVAALVCLCLAYAIPASVVGVMDLSMLRNLYVPVPTYESGWLANVLPGAAQAAGMCWVLAHRVRRGLAAAPRIAAAD